MPEQQKLTLNIAALLKDTSAVGPGIRDVIWLQGCTIDCPDCANQAYLPHEPRVTMPIAQLIAHFKARKHKIDGCTISGGEPTEQLEAVSFLLQQIKAMGLSTVVYTGRTLKSLRAEQDFEQLLSHTDLLIDGPFIKKLENPALLWRGSRNQGLHLLSDRWTPNDIQAQPPSGEIIISTAGITCISGRSKIQ